jgi:putative two-component system response regulator
MSQKRILIIEDNPVNMELASDLLEVAGYQTIQADNAEDGIRMAQEHLPDLVLMDIALPGMDGLTATTILRQQPATSSIPIIALTAHAMRGDEDKALAVGCVGYITKPINTRSFSRMVKEFADQAPSAPAAPRPAPVAPVVPAPIPVRVDAPAPTAPAPVPVFADSVPLTIPARVERAPEPAVTVLDVPDAMPLAPLPLGPVASPLMPANPISPVALEPVELLPIPSDPVTPATLLRTAEADRLVEPPIALAPEIPVAKPAVPANEDITPYLLIPRRGRGGRSRKGEAIALVQETSTARILVVDDDELNREMITAQLRMLGYEPTVVNDGFQALDAVDDTYDLVLLDFMMPGMDGAEVCRQIREEKNLTDLPIIMVTALSNREDQLRAVQNGANDWITKPVDRNELQVRVKSQLKYKAAQDALRRHQRDLEATVRARTSELRKALEQVTSEQERTNEAYLDTMHRLALASEFRDGFMAAAHIRCVGNYCAAIARGMGLPDNVSEVLLHASPLHDIGMLGIPEDVVAKGDGRNPDEELHFRDHTMLGARLLSGARSELLRAAEVIALSHHEKWDGSGYPHGRSGESIPLYGRICAVADTFDTITAYKGGEWQATNDEAKEVLLAGRGTDFDPAIVDAFFKQWHEIEMFQKRYRRTEAPPEDLLHRRLVAA